MTPLGKSNRALKRAFDLLVSISMMMVLIGPMLIFWILSTISFKKNGLYSQSRIGYKGGAFRMFKFRTMNVRSSADEETEAEAFGITIEGDPRINGYGRWLRRWKIDELPQLINVIAGDMSLVGPRPDLPGFADRLKGEDRIVLEVTPGITGPATLKYRNEESLLKGQKDPVAFNMEKIWPDKVRINKNYVRNWSFKNDLKILINTIFG